MLSEGRVVLTDRLHAVILSCLLGRPMVALDNTYGKIGSFVDTWLSQWPALIRATDAQAAAAGVERLLAADGAP
jgi:exopolysaccharide biosynthesis predicted pyruvyltransferase EpsI